MTATSERNDPDRSRSAQTPTETITDTVGTTMSVDTVRFDAARAHVKVVGELDLATAAPLWAVLQGHLAAGRRYLRLDLSEVTFIDATALSGITRAHRDLLAVRGTLVITGVRARVHRVLRLTGLDEVLFVGGARADDDTFAPDEHAELLAAHLETIE